MKLFSNVRKPVRYADTEKFHLHADPFSLRNKFHVSLANSNMKQAVTEIFNQQS